MTVESVKEIRRVESERAAGLLAAEAQFFDAGLRDVLAQRGVLWRD